MLSFMGKTQASECSYVLGSKFGLQVRCQMFNQYHLPKNDVPSPTHIIVQQDSHFLANVLLQRGETDKCMSVFVGSPFRTSYYSLYRD